MGGGIGDAVALQAIGVWHPDWTGDVEATLGPCAGLAGQFLGFRILLEGMQQAHLPIGRTVFDIGGIERGLAVAEVRKAPAQFGERCLSAVGRHNLGVESVEAELPDERCDFLAGVGAHYEPHLQQHARALDDLFARQAKLNRMGDVARDGEAEEKTASQNEPETIFYTHCAAPVA
jgi:hypothetical protein